MLERIAGPSSRGWLPCPCSSYTAGRFFTAEPPGKPLVSVYTQTQMGIYVSVLI